ncbi:MAG: hypothetical protein FWC79_02435 [Oscillospiraceae bacterium]|nr:hypothetical protein [Oscillospiraceae bacterium]
MKARTKVVATVMFAAFLFVVAVIAVATNGSNRRNEPELEEMVDFGEDESFVAFALRFETLSEEGVTRTTGSAFEVKDPVANERREMDFPLGLSDVWLIMPSEARTVGYTVVQTRRSLLYEPFGVFQITITFNSYNEIVGMYTNHPNVEVDSGTVTIFETRRRMLEEGQIAEFAVEFFTVDAMNYELNTGSRFIFLCEETEGYVRFEIDEYVRARHVLPVEEGLLKRAFLIRQEKPSIEYASMEYDILLEVTFNADGTVRDASILQPIDVATVFFTRYGITVAVREFREE